MRAEKIVFFVSIVVPKCMSNRDQTQVLWALTSITCSVADFDYSLKVLSAHLLISFLDIVYRVLHMVLVWSSIENDIYPTSAETLRTKCCSLGHYITNLQIKKFLERKNAEGVKSVTLALRPLGKAQAHSFPKIDLHIPVTSLSVYGEGQEITEENTNQIRQIPADIWRLHPPQGYGKIRRDERETTVKSIQNRNQIYCQILNGLTLRESTSSLRDSWDIVPFIVDHL